MTVILLSLTNLHLVFFTRKGKTAIIVCPSFAVAQLIANQLIKNNSCFNCCDDVGYADVVENTTIEIG